MMKRKTNQTYSEMMNDQGIIRHLDLFSQQLTNIILRTIRRTQNIQNLLNQKSRFFYIINFKHIELSRGIL